MSYPGYVGGEKTLSAFDSVILTIGGSAAALILGYVLNGWRERNFERRKTNYHSKLAAFKEINEAIWGLDNAYVYLRMVIDIAEHPAETESTANEVLVYTSIARDLEVPLGTKTCEGVISDWNSISHKVPPAKESDKDEVLDWLVAAGMNLTILYLRALNYHFGKLIKASLDARLVAKTTLVEKAIEDLGKYLSKKLTEFPLAVVEEKQRPIPEEVFDFVKIEAELDPLLEALQSAMHDELATTL